MKLISLQSTARSIDVLFTEFCWAPGTETIPLDPTFGSFTLLELVSHSVNWFLW
jgi:hypothetical protein